MTIGNLIFTLVGVIVGALIMMLIVKSAGAIPRGRMEAQQRSCVASLNIRTTEADSLKFIFVQGYDECKHWVIREGK